MAMQASGFDGAVHRLPVRVYFEDTDLSGVVYHANYLRFMERGRSTMLADAGIDQRAAFDGGDGVYAVASVELRFRAPARLNDDLVVESRLDSHRGATARVHQRVMRGDEILVEGWVVAAFLDMTGRPRRTPRAWVEIFQRLEQGGR